MNFILKNIHTIILLIGIGLIMYGLFLISQTVGYIGSGVLAIMLATYIDRNARQGMKHTWMFIKKYQTKHIKINQKGDTP